jgi:tetratricopeptide (TPR) repeat protein
MSLPTDHAGIVALQALQMKDEMEFRKAPRGEDPVQQVDGLASLMRERGSFFGTKGGIYNAASEFDTYITKDKPDAKTLALKLQPVQAALKAMLPSFYSGMFDTEMARILLKDDFDLPTAEALAQSGVALYDKSDCLQDDRYAAESHHVFDESRAKHPVPFTYHAEEGEQHCAQSIASRYAMLGKIEATRHEVDAATESFQKALHEQPNADAALGLAAIDKAKGDEQGELEMYNIAFLTGSLSPDDVKSARALYAKLHPGSAPSSYDALLDARYSKTFANPVIANGERPAPSTPQHVVLEELFTGADCEPCIAPDLATEAVLRHYDRSQVVVAVYHDNAPGPDPLTTTVSEGRGKYYGTGGSTPHVMVDGKEIEIEEGPPSHAQSSFDIISKTIDPLLSSHRTAELQAISKRRGEVVEVTVTGKAPILPAKAHLQILLVETEISDTGKNTLRFQPMVVRAAAASKDGDLGLSLDRKGSFSKVYSFDLKKVEADNLAYYDHYREGFEARMAAFVAKGYMTKAKIDEMAQFREPKNQVHPDRLAVVVFLQADDTKEVLQSRYSAVVAAQEEGR